MGAIYRKEIKSYFNSIVGYLFIGFFWAIIGLYHFIYNYGYGLADYSVTTGSLTLFFMFLIPLLTMRIMAEENRQKTDQLLFTSPVSVAGVMIGKYLAMLTILAIVIAGACFQPLILSAYGDVNLKAAFVSLLGLFLLGAVYIAIGLYVSAHTESQVFAAVITVVIILFTNLIDAIAALFGTDAFTAWLVFSVCVLLIALISYLAMRNVIVAATVFALGEIAVALIYLINPAALENSVSGVFGWFSVVARFDSFSTQLFSVADTVYYLTVAALFVFLSVESVEKRRWNG